MLVNFRANPIGLIADIEKAFVMIGIKEEDRELVRFVFGLAQAGTRLKVSTKIVSPADPTHAHILSEFHKPWCTSGLKDDNYTQ